MSKILKSLVVLMLLIACSALAQTDYIDRYNATWGYTASDRNSSSIDTIVAYYGFNISDNGKFDKETIFDTNGLIAIYRKYEVLPNYIIPRDAANLIQLTNDSNIAWHAGISKMPAPDNRTGVNQFSIGLRIICANETIAQKLSMITEKDASLYGPTNEQYALTARFIAAKAMEYPIRNFVFYDQIKPKGKLPGSNIDLEKLNKALEKYDLMIVDNNLIKL